MTHDYLTGYTFSMLNIFPDLLILSFFAPLILRLALGAWLLFLGWRHFFKERHELSAQLSARWGNLGKVKAWLIGPSEGIIGALLIVGFLTQPAALLSALVALDFLIIKKKLLPSLAPESPWLYALALAVSLSLLLTGAGAFALDRPF